LREFVQEISVANYMKLVEVFPQCGEGSGYTLEDILNEDIVLIIRDPDFNYE
jgi:hypothetical protein